MLSLIELIKFRNSLTETINSFEVSTHVSYRINELTTLKSLLTTYEPPIDQRINRYVELLHGINHNETIFADLLNTVKNDIDQLITESSVDSDEIRWLANKYDQQDLTDPTVCELIKVKIQSYCDWHYPGLFINPCFKSWVDCVTTCDPLYLTFTATGDFVLPPLPNGEHSSRSPSIAPSTRLLTGDKKLALDKLQNVIGEYPDLFQRRVRLYTINDRKLAVLPVRQFGFVLSWNFFNHISLDIIKIYLAEVFNLLRPGGVFMFSYNNCDSIATTELCYTNNQPFANHRLIKNLAKDLGYEVIQFTDYTDQISVAEIKRPGILTTIKLSQVTGEIISN